MSTLTHLECGLCGKEHEADRLWNLCPACDRPLLARYDLARAAATLTPAALRGREPTLWRYAEVLPVRDLPTSDVTTLAAFAQDQIQLGASRWTLIPALRIASIFGSM